MWVYINKMTSKVVCDEKVILDKDDYNELIKIKEKYDQLKTNESKRQMKYTKKKYEEDIEFRKKKIETAAEYNKTKLKERLKNDPEFREEYTRKRHEQYLRRKEKKQLMNNT